MTNILREQALRLALYLFHIGIDPQVSGASYHEYLSELTPVYCSVPGPLRKRGRREGRKAIREAGGVEPASSHLLPEPKLAPAISGPWKRSYEKHFKRMLNWSPETPPCLECRIGGFLPKRSWPSREAAEASRIVQNDPRLVSYPCPISRGFGISAMAVDGAISTCTTIWAHSRFRSYRPCREQIAIRTRRSLADAFASVRFMNKSHGELFDS